MMLKSVILGKFATCAVSPTGNVITFVEMLG
jgi:hypothetical protein